MPSATASRTRPHTRGRGRRGGGASRRAGSSRTATRSSSATSSTAAGEIDVVARDGETLCFLEIKARATADFGPAIAAVDARKQRRISRAAALYLA